MPPPRSAYHPPKEPDKLDRKETLKFLERQISGTSDPVANGAFLLVVQEVRSGRLA